MIDDKYKWSDNYGWLVSHTNQYTEKRVMRLLLEQEMNSTTHEAIVELFQNFQLRILYCSL